MKLNWKSQCLSGLGGMFVDYLQIAWLERMGGGGGQNGPFSKISDVSLVTDRHFIGYQFHRR